LHAKWADGVRAAGGNPDTIKKELDAALTQFKAAY